jgi:hypothetical protein
MVKTVYLARRNPDTTYEEFLRNWRHHAKLSGTFPAIVAAHSSVVQCARIPGLEQPGINQDYDGANLLGLRSLLLALQVFDDPARDVLRADELRVFSTFVEDTSLITVETVLSDQPIGKCLLLELVAKRDDLDKASFIKSWSGRSAGALMETDAFKESAGRYVHNHVVVPPPAGYEFDGVGEVWFDDVPSAQQFLDSDGFTAYSESLLEDVAASRVLLLLQTNHVWFE